MNEYVRRELAARHPSVDHDYFNIYNRLNSNHLFSSFHSAAEALLGIVAQDKISSREKISLSTFEINTIDEAIVTMVKMGFDHIANNDTISVPGDLSDIDAIRPFVEIHEGEINAYSDTFVKIPVSFIMQELSYALAQLYGPKEERITKLIAGSYYNLMYSLYQLAIPDIYNIKMKKFYKNKVDSCIENGVDKSEYIWYIDN